MSGISHKQERLVARIRQIGDCLVAFSAGVDSSVVAKAAQVAVGERALAVTAVSPSLAEGELQQARDLAALIGIRHEVIETAEIENPDYTRNAADRCYHCKTELYQQLELLAAGRPSPAATLLNGANLDDQGDYRPGLKAAGEHRVVSPLIDCGLGKQDVRELAAAWQLPVWDKPATPCLSSRIAYGEQVTPARLRMIDQAEQFLKQLGFEEVRVRYHKGDVARIEVAADALSRLADEQLRVAVVARLRDVGFRFIALDLEGFRSGSLNQLVKLAID